MTHDENDHDDIFFQDPAFAPEEEHEEPAAPGWRRPLLIVVASITALAMAMVPLYNLFDTAPPVADNGLEVCGFDYCVVQDAARAGGIGDTMSRLANTFLGDEEAVDLANSLLEGMGQGDVSFIVVERLDGDLKGQYHPASRTIYVERPVRAWIVVHEVAHVRASGHGADFQDALVDLAHSLESPGT